MDFGAGQMSVPVSQIGVNSGDVSRSSSFCAEKAPSALADSIAGDGLRAGQLGLRGRGYSCAAVADDAFLERWDMRVTDYYKHICSRIRFLPFEPSLFCCYEMSEFSHLHEVHFYSGDARLIGARMPSRAYVRVVVCPRCH